MTFILYLLGLALLAGGIVWALYMGAVAVGLAVVAWRMAHSSASSYWASA